VRPGIITYGLYPGKEIKELFEKEEYSLKPVLSWKTRIARLHNLKPGETVSYGRTFVAEKPIIVGLLPVGYYDGYHRSYRDGYVLVNGIKCSLIGTVCMNMMMVDITDCSHVKVGDEVVLIGQQDNQKITAEDLAIRGGTINYEAVTCINKRIPRIII